MSINTLIKKTKDYGKFKVFTINRPINEGLVKKIMSSIEQIGYIEGKPILVDKTFTIIDGQHRFTACERLGIEIVYSMVNEKLDPKEVIVQLNAQQRSWNAGNYIHMWAESGIKCYKELLDFEERRQFGINNSMTICFKGDLSMKKIKEGHRFPINEHKEKTAAFIIQCADIVPYWKTSKFVQAATALFKVATTDQIKKVISGLISVPQMAKYSDYLTAFENIINKGLRDKNRVSFK
jgi:hypothetical protein